jgi:hypothetical protein
MLGGLFQGAFGTMTGEAAAVEVRLNLFLHMGCSRSP